MQNDLKVNYYLVIFLDLLGQRERLRQITHLPTNDDETQKFIPLIKVTYGNVLAMRNGFKKFFDGYNSRKPNVALVPVELRKEFAESQKSDAYFYGMSDANIIAVSLMSPKGNENCTAMQGVYAAFASTCGMGLLSLSTKIPMRGGLDIGLAAPIEGKEIYGPAFERAYSIESQLAEYPRFVVGDELISYITLVESQQPTTRLGHIANELAKLCKEMIIRDSDGRYMLDFLGVTVKEGADKGIDQEIVKNAYEFVKSQHEHFLKKDNMKLTARYYRLKRYFDSRLSLWGIEKT